MFLINYDLLSIAYIWSDTLSKIGKTIEYTLENDKI